LLAIIAVLAFTIPYVVRHISLQQTDENLINRLDKTFELIDSLGMNSFIDSTDSSASYGSYNILKEEYISIERTDSDSLVNYIATTQRLVDSVVVDYRVLSYSFEQDGKYYLVEIGESIQTVYSFEKQLRRYAIVFMLLLLALTVFFEVFIIRYLLRPLEKIITRIKLSNNPASFNYDKILTSTSDFLYLQETIHRMMHRIEKAFNSEREYIGNVSHELLTPISIIQSKLENLINTGNLPDNELNKIYESKKTLGRLTLMVRSLLMFSRIENEEYPKSEEVDLIQVVNNVTEELVDKANAKELHITQDYTIDKVIIKGNRELLFNMLYNLVNNAIKYTKQGGIHVNINKLNNKTVITIEDTGEGIQSKDLENIFNRFERANLMQDGYGLGLALVQKICEYHSIKIKVNSLVGVGTTFTLTIENTGDNQAK